MKKIGESYITKCISVAIIIFTMLFSSITPIISWAAEHLSNEEDYSDKITFDITWDETEVTAGKDYGVKFGLTLTGVESGFKNLKITVEDSDTPKASIDAKKSNMGNSYVNAAKSTSKVLAFKDKVDSGVSVDGTIVVNFRSAKDFQNYNKEIKIILTGEYVDPITGENQYICITKTIKASIKTPDYYDYFTAGFDMHASVARNTSIESGMAEGEYLTTTITAGSDLFIEGHNIAYGKYNWEIERTSSIADKTSLNSEENLSIEIENCPDFIRYNIQRNNDGKTNIIFEVGEEKDSYTEKELFDLGNTITIIARYKMVENSLVNKDYNGTSTVYINYNANVIGYDMKKNASGIEYTKQTKEFYKTHSDTIRLGYKFGDYLASAEISTDNTTTAAWEKEIEDGYADITYYTDTLYWDRRPIEEKEKLIVYGYKENENAYLTYIADDGTSKRLELTGDEFKLKKIYFDKSQFHSVPHVNFIKRGETEPFFTVTTYGGSNSIDLDDDANITDYYAEFDYMYGTRVNTYPKWYATYTLDINKLKEKLSEDEIKNIRSITRYQNAVFGTQTGVNKNTEASFSIWKPSTTTITPDSYFEVELNNMNTSVSQYGIYTDGNIKLKMYKDEEKFGESTVFYNKNPKFYVKLPEFFDYDDIKVTTSSNRMVISNSECTDKNEKAWYINENGYLVINCVGTWSHSQGEFDINISFKKKLNTYAVSANNSVYGYMITDNANYYHTIDTKNTSNLSKNGEVPEKLGYAKCQFVVTGDDSVQIRNGVVLGEKNFFPTTTSDTKLGTKENAVKVAAGDTAKYKTELSTNGKSISKINVISRLPMAENKSIYGTTYSLDSAISLTNLNNIKVKYFNNNTESDIDSSKYKILYSTDIDANFDTTFTDYVEGDTNIQNAKTIQILFDDSYVLSGNAQINIYYEMEMPDVEGISGQISAVKYQSSDNKETILEPSAVYVKKGNPNGVLTLHKLFEGYDAGKAPSGVSLSGIEFKIKNIKTNEILIREGQTDAEGKIATDDSGTLVLGDIPAGKYEIIECSEIPGFDGIDYTIFEIINGDSIEKSVTNKRKYSKLIVQKHWNIPDDVQQGSVAFKLTRFGDKIQYTGTERTNVSNGKAEFYVKYGTYKLEESEGKTGWKMASLPSNITIDSEEEIYHVGNYIPTTSLVITKTLPKEGGSEETVEGISFNIKGTAYADSYIDKNGEVQDLTYENTIVVGQNTENVRQTISDDKKSVEIAISGLYAGNYTITEVDMPKLMVDGEEINRYMDLVRTISLEPETTNRLLLENVWKKGTIKIQKTAEEGVELDQFKFRVQGTSYYGTEVDQVISINEDGTGRGSVLIGNYTIEEIGADGFDATYTMTIDGEDVTTKNSATFKLDGKNTININVENKNVDGYVKIVKTMEGTDDVSKAKGIQFEVNGVAPSGANVHEVITIGEDGTGTSQGIPAGGEYELSEVSSTVPDNYEIIDPMPIEISKRNTEENPLVLNLDNKRGRGNLYISTETMPEGGDVYPIEYKIQEIDIDDSKGTYERVEGTEQRVDGDLVGRASFINLLSGTYIVEQISVPSGWKRDVPQIVDVPIDDDANAVFIIEKTEELEDTRVTITKTVLNPQDKIATDADYTKYKLNKNESFEVKLTNVSTGKEYFTFISPDTNGIIEGLPSGRYEVEEVYKPKYLVKSYNLVEKTESSINAVDNKYYIEIGNAESGKNYVTIHIENKINDKFGFGGQDSKENLSKIDAEKFEEIENATISRASIVVADEEGNKIDNCTFELYDSNGNKILDFVPKSKQTIIKGLEPGVYTIKNTNVPDGYLLTDDCYITVYEDAVRTKRIEIQKNIPRGSLTLQTLYKNDLYNNDDEIKFVPKSKYQIANSTTGELMTFVKNADGSYKRSNSADAVDTISVRAGKVTITGIETDTYEVGIVDIANGYGIVNNDVIVADIVKDETKEVGVMTTKRSIIDIQSGYDQTYVLDNFGDLWGWGYGYYGVGDGTTSDISEPVKIKGGAKKISVGYYGKALINQGGYVETWGKNENGILGCESSDTSSIVKTPTTIAGYMQGKKAKDVSIGYYSLLVLDEDNKLWYAGSKYACGLGYDYINNKMGSTSYITGITCLSDVEGSPFKNINIKKVYAGYNMNAVIDDKGRLWTWNSGSTGYLGYSSSDYKECYEPKCVSLREGNDIYEAYKKGIKIVDCCDCFALDEDGNVYFFNTGYSFPANATSITKEGGMFAGKKFKKIASNTGGSSYDKHALIDDENKLYINFDCINDKEKSKFKDVQFDNVSVGYRSVIAMDKNYKLYGKSSSSSNYGQLGAYYDTREIESRYNGNNMIEYQFSVPNYAAHFKYDMKFKKTDMNYYATIALDEDGNLWSWGNGDYNATGNSAGYNYSPRRIEFNENVKFRDIVTEHNGYYQTWAVDTDGRVWTWGYSSSNNMSGAGGAANGMTMAKTCISELEDNPLAIAYSEGIKIEEIKVGYYVVMARDNRNKIWVWGNNATKFASGIDPTTPTCLSDLGGLKDLYDRGLYVKKYQHYKEYFTFIDNEGTLWFMKDGTLTSLADLNTTENSLLSKDVVENATKIVDIAANGSSYLAILDDKGRVWCKESDMYKETCYSTKEDGVLATSYAEGNKIVSLQCYNYGYALGIDNNGHIWCINYDECIADSAEYISATTYDSSYLAIDKDQHLWIWGNNNYGKLGNGNNLQVEEPTITTGAVANTLKDVEFINVGRMQAESKDGYMYTTSYNDNQWKKSYQTVTYLENQGIKIKQQQGNYVIDEDGKLYYGNSDRINNGNWIYVTDTEDYDLYNAYYSDGIGIKEIISDTNGVVTYFLDTNNRLWGTDFALVGNFEYKRIVAIAKQDEYPHEVVNVIVEDADGYYWINGSNEYGLLGNGGAEVESEKTFVKIVLDGDLKIGELVFFDERAIYLKDENGTVWSWGNNYVSIMGISDSTSIVKTPHNWGIQAQELIVVRYDNYNEFAYSVFVLDTDGAVWSCGYGTGNDWTDGALGKSSRLLGKVNNSDSMGTIVKLTVAADCCYAINDQGELWVWGDNAYGALGYETNYIHRYTDSRNSDYEYCTFATIRSPVCVTNKLGSVYYQKQIKDVISLTGYYNYTSDINKGVYQAGNGEVLVVTEDNEFYRMGHKGRVVSNYAQHMYYQRKGSPAVPFPQPKLVQIEGNITNIKYLSGKTIYLQTDTGAVYKSTGSCTDGYLWTDTSPSSSFYSITKDEYRDLSLDEIYKLDNASYSNNYTLDTANHKIIYKYMYGEQVRDTAEFTYPSQINVDKFYVESPTNSTYATIYIVDKNGDLWVKGYYSGLGKTLKQFTCVTKLENSSEAVWNTIRGRWNLISRRY